MNRYCPFDTADAPMAAARAIASQAVTDAGVSADIAQRRAANRSGLLRTPLTHPADLRAQSDLEHARAVAIALNHPDAAERLAMLGATRVLDALGGDYADVCDGRPDDTAGWELLRRGSPYERSIWGRRARAEER